MNTASTRTYRTSRQRQRILSYLQASHDHPSAIEIYHVLKAEMPSLSLGNLYRNLNILVEQQHIVKLSTQGTTEDRFDGNMEDHIHARCTSCKRIFDIPCSQEMGKALLSLDTQGFHTESFTINLQGLCKDCC